jgi:hypothetical protein
MSDNEIEVGEEKISEEEWAQLMARAHEKRGQQPAVPDNIDAYLNRTQLASIRKLEEFGWELFFIRRSDPDEVLTVMYLPRLGETAVIEKDGTVNRAHGVPTRADR